MPKTLTEVLADPATQSAVIDDCVLLIDAEVAEKSGISGFAIKCGYAAAKGAKAGFPKTAVETLLPKFASVLDPICREAQSHGVALDAHFVANRGRVAEALLAITDAKAARSQSGVVRGTYERLRRTAKQHVEAAVPRLATMIRTRVS